MQVVRIKYNRARTGTISLQAQYRGRATRRLHALTKIQSYRRMYLCKTAYRKMKSATISLQCCVRRGIAKTEFNEIKRAQKDMGKLKEHNEKLKMEMASLKAMLQAQAATDAGKAESEKIIKEKEKEVKQLESRVSQLERELANEKELVQKLEKELVEQRTIAGRCKTCNTKKNWLRDLLRSLRMLGNTPAPNLLGNLFQQSQLPKLSSLDTLSLLKPWLCTVQKWQG